MLQRVGALESPETFSKTLEDIRVLQGAINKRARTRLRRKRRNPPKPTRALSHSEQMGLAPEPMTGVVGTEGACPGTNANPLPHPCGPAVARVHTTFTTNDRTRALRNYELFHQLPCGTAVIAQVIGSSAGIQGWLDSDSDALVKVGREVFPSSLCGLWARRAISAVADLPEWERIVLTVDSGASETVVPPDVASCLPLLHTSQVGTEYEVANGGVVVNLGERRADVIMKLGSKTSMILSFQVVKVHKPLLAVSRLVEAGHKVLFDKDDPHIMLSSGEKVAMKCHDGTYEIELWIRNPGFARPTTR